MSYQTSHYFDPTALLMIKAEVDQSISAVESTVNALVEDQTLPFAIDDALHQIEQCARVLALIDLPDVGKVAQYCAELMRKIMQNPSNLNAFEIEALSEGTTMLKRYLEFASLREINVPSILLDSVNRLELALGKPLTHDGAELAQCFSNGSVPTFQLPAVETVERSAYVHQLYKLSLNHLLQHKRTKTDFKALKLVGVYLVNLAQGQASEQYWGLVNLALTHLDAVNLTDARLRTLVRVEQHIGQFLESAESFRPSLNHVADVLALCVIQDSEFAESIREQLNIQNHCLTNSQQQTLLQQFYAPSDETIREVCNLLRDEINDIRREVEYNYQNLSVEQLQELQHKLYSVAYVMKVLNLEDIYELLRNQAHALIGVEASTQSELFAQNMMNSVLSATNALGVLERQYISNRLQLGVFNTEIVLDQVEKAHESLLNESKHDIIAVNQQFMDYVREPQTEKLSEIIDKLIELSGAALFLGQEKVQQALINCAKFIRLNIETNMPLDAKQINLILNVLAAMDLFVENLLNKQPVLTAMFDIALDSSKKLS